MYRREFLIGAGGMAVFPAAAAPRHGPGRRAAGFFGRVLRSRVALFIGFTFAVMADPVSSVAYAIEAALRALDGDLGLLLATMTLVIAIICVIVINYQQIVDRFPHGGGAAAAAAEAFGFGWAFLPLGALLVDFVLTIAISSAAAASAIIAFDPRLAPLPQYSRPNHVPTVAWRLRVDSSERPVTPIGPCSGWTITKSSSSPRSRLASRPSM